VSLSYNIDLVGRVFYRLTVLAFSHLSASRYRYWRCRCECGAETVVSGFNLIVGNQKSCGCSRGRNYRNTVTGRFDYDIPF
jgi:hypothetical protein